MSKPDWIPFENNYVLVREFDCSAEDAVKYNHGRRGPIAHETLLDEAQTLRRAFESIASPYSYNKRYGRVTIARLVFEDIPLDILMTELANHDKETT